MWIGCLGVEMAQVQMTTSLRCLTAATLIDPFDEVLKQAGITHNSHGEKYSLYSLRRWYAITYLRKGFGVFEVARNMGTSVQMIQAYYGKQATAATLAIRLGD